MNFPGVVPPPPGVTPDIAAASPILLTYSVSVAVSLFVATALLALRIYTAMFVAKNSKLDSFFLLASYLCSVGYCIIQMKSAISYGLGKHLWDVAPAQLAKYLSFLYTTMMTYSWCLSLSKLSMLALYHNINPSRGFHWALYAVGSGIVGCQVAFTIMFVGPCKPTDPNTAECFTRSALAQAVLNIIFDTFIIVLPIPTIHSLNMPWRQKCFVGFLLGLGSAAMIVSLSRVSTVKALEGDPDILAAQGVLAILSVWEINVGIWCNCLCRLKPFIDKHFPRLAAMLASTTRSKPGGYLSDRGVRGLGTGEGARPVGTVQVLSECEVHAASRERSTDTILKEQRRVFARSLV
ncbi:hypothetical protein PG995_006466 [Apiospora arundinis]